MSGLCGEGDGLAIFDDYEEFQSAWHAAAEERHPGVTQSAWNREVVIMSDNVFVMRESLEGSGLTE